MRRRGKVWKNGKMRYVTSGKSEIEAEIKKI
jgi:hypothetical protein